VVVGRVRLLGERKQQLYSLRSLSGKPLPESSRSDQQSSARVQEAGQGHFVRLVHLQAYVPCWFVYRVPRGNLAFLRVGRMSIARSEVPSYRHFEFNHGIAAANFYGDGVANIAEAAGGVVDHRGQPEILG